MTFPFGDCYIIGLLYNIVFNFLLQFEELSFKIIVFSALFLMRSIEGKEALPDDLKDDFFTAEQTAREKLQSLKTVIGETFPVRKYFLLSV